MQQASYVSEPNPQRAVAEPPRSFTPSNLVWLLGVVVVGTSAALVLLKPSKQAYVHHVAPNFVQEVQTAYCPGVALPEAVQPIGKFAQTLCRSVIAGGATAIGPDRLEDFVNNNSICQDYILFNRCTTEFPGKKMTQVGVLGQFVVLPQK
jgi:Domain of unknown function (DUF4359)